MKLLKRMIGDQWEVRRTIWPYKDGWGTYNSYRRTVLHTGLPTKEEAQRLCDDLNDAHPSRGEK